MKRKVILLIVAAVAVLAFSSCKKDYVRCWKGSYRYKGFEYVEYAWCTEAEMLLSVEQLKSTGDYTNITFMSVDGYASRAECLDNNVQ